MKSSSYCYKDLPFLDKEDGAGAVKLTVELPLLLAFRVLELLYYSAW